MNDQLSIGLLAPSILSFSALALKNVIPTLVAGGADIIHLDIMDGQFVPPISFGDALVSNLRPLTTAFFEAHLMTLTPELHFDAFEKAGCQRIIFHAEVTAHSCRLAQEIRSRGMSPGIAINPGTPVEMIAPVLHLIDLALVMTVNPGWGGQKYIETNEYKMTKLRSWRPDLMIEVDGGIDPTTLPAAKKAGANVFVVGSHLARASDLMTETQRMKTLCG